MISAVVLTFNEERNLPGCLESLAPVVSETFVVDSGSTDRTREIALRAGARFVTHPFESHALQWRWALRELPIGFDWILALDADQRLSAELAAEIVTLRSAGRWDGARGFYLPRRQIFRGRWIRHGGYYPKYLLKLFRKTAVTVDETDRVDHHFRVAGRTAKLRGDLIEANANEADISSWVEKHARYALLQAREEIARQSGEGDEIARLFGAPDERAAWLKRRWRSMPLYARAFAYFFYRYVVRMGFLDGREGLIFHFLQGCWYRFLVDVNIDELRRQRGCEARKHSASPSIARRP